MPKLGCNGYSLFAEQMKPALEQKLGKQLMKFNDVVKAAAPYWSKLSDDEKRRWKERAKDYKRSDDFVSKRREVRLQHFESREKRREVEDGGLESNDFEEDEDYSDFEDPNELPGPVDVSSHKAPHSDLFNCLPGGDFSWKKRGMTPCELGEFMLELEPLTPQQQNGSGSGRAPRQFKTNSYWRSDRSAAGSHTPSAASETAYWYNKRRTTNSNTGTSQSGGYWRASGYRTYEVPPRMRKQKEQPQRQFYARRNNQETEQTQTDSRPSPKCVPDLSSSTTEPLLVAGIASEQEIQSTTESKVNVKSSVVTCELKEQSVDVFLLTDGDAGSILRVLKVSEAVL